MHFEFRESDVLSEFMALSLKCESLPNMPKSKPEWILKNRYSNIQPCKPRLGDISLLNYRLQIQNIELSLMIAAEIILTPLIGR